MHHYPFAGVGARVWRRPAVAAAVLVATWLSCAASGAVLAAARGLVVPGDPLAGSGEIDRDVLTRRALLEGAAPRGPVDESALALPAEAAHPEHTFVGRLELVGQRTRGGWRVLQDRFGLGGQPDRRYLPDFDFPLVQLGSHLIPLRRGLVITSHARWNYILEPGRVWQERSDNGLSRASLPFALVDKNQNCTHNGTLTFLFGRSTVSSVWYQVTQETCFYFKADLWGMVDAVYHPGGIRRKRRVRRAYVREVKRRIPTAPIEQLAGDYPGTDPRVFGSSVTPRHRTAYGLYAGGTNYVGNCPTRFGEYPHCKVMRLPSYSTAKSAFGGAALMRLVRLYGDRVRELRIRDYVPEAAAAAGDWSEVTFENALDMTTGHYWSAGAFEDENGPRMSRFYDAESYPARIAAAFDAPYRQRPGSHWVYRSGDTFILTSAMQAFLEEMAGPGADIFDLVVDDIFRPLDIGPGAHTIMRTSENGWQGQALGYLGLFWTHDDIAKISRFFNVGDGRIKGRQVLPPGLLAATMQRDPTDRGLLAGDDWMYNQGFHALRWNESELWPGQAEFWTPFMLGYGGIVFVMMPNGTVYYHASDNDQFGISAAVRESMSNIPGEAGSRSPRETR